MQPHGPKSKHVHSEPRTAGMVHGSQKGDKSNRARVDGTDCKVLKQRKLVQQLEDANVTYEDIPTTAEVKLKSGDFATIAVRKRFSDGVPDTTKVDSLASSKIGQSLKKGGIEKNRVADSVNLPVSPRTRNGGIVQGAKRGRAGSETPVVEPLQLSVPFIHLALPPDEHGHDYVTVKPLCTPD